MQPPNGCSWSVMYTGTHLRYLRSNCKLKLEPHTVTHNPCIVHSEVCNMCILARKGRRGKSLSLNYTCTNWQTKLFYIEQLIFFLIFQATILAVREQQMWTAFLFLANHCLMRTYLSVLHQRQTHLMVLTRNWPRIWIQVS